MVILLKDGIAVKKDDNTQKKLILIGPAAAGKTTFKRVFFENVNPLKMIDEGLDPTRGIENTTLTYFAQSVGVWDLSGQEIRSWLGDRQDVFDAASTIVCMMSASDSVADNLVFLTNFLKVHHEVAPASDLFLLLNKCDLVSSVNIRNMVTNIQDWIRVKSPTLSKYCTATSFYSTSILESFFLRTLRVVLKIIRSCLRDKLGSLPVIDLQDAEKRIRLLMVHSPGIWFSSLDVSQKLSMPMVEVHGHLEALRAGGYVLKRKSSLFCVSEKGGFIARALKQQPDAITEPGAATDLIAYLDRFRLRK